MKTLFFACSLFCLLIAQAQDEEIPAPSRVIKMNPWEFIDNTFFLELESFNDEANQSWNFGVGFKTPNDWYGEEVYGAMGEIAKRFYLKGMSVHTPKKEPRSLPVGCVCGILSKR